MKIVIIYFLATIMIIIGGVSYLMLSSHHEGITGLLFLALAQIVMTPASFFWIKYFKKVLEK
jgi:hypothetical protein